MIDWKEDYYDIWQNIKFEFLKNWKARRSLVAVSISVLLSSLFYFVPVLTGNEFPSDANEFLATSMGLMNYVLILNAIFFGSDAVNGEHHRKTTLLIYPLPQRRSVIMFGKYIVHLLTSWVVIFIYYSVTAVETAGIYGFDAIPNDMLKSLLFSFLYMAALLSIAFLLSALVRNPAVSMALTFFLFFLLLPTLNSLLTMIEADSSWILTNYSGIITKIFRFPSDTFGPRHLRSSNDIDFYEGIRVCLVYMIGSFLGSWILTLRKEV